jgi:hypothetical protein
MAVFIELSRPVSALSDDSKNGDVAHQRTLTPLHRRTSIRACD